MQNVVIRVAYIMSSKNKKHFSALRKDQDTDIKISDQF